MAPQQKSVVYVPWVLDPKSKEYDELKACEQKAKDDLLKGLEEMILEIKIELEEMDKE